MQENQSIEWMTKGQAIALRINVLWYNRFVFRQQLPFLWEKPGPLRLALVGLVAGWLADEIRLDFEILKILYRSNYLVFYFVYSSTMLLIVLEVHFSLLFSNKACCRGNLWCIKFICHLLTTYCYHKAVKIYQCATKCRCYWSISAGQYCTCPNNCEDYRQ